VTDTEKIIAVSLFSGGGGFDVGIEHAGFSVRASCDVAEYACETLRANFRSRTVIGPPEHSGDLRTMSIEVFMDEARVQPGDVALLYGGPPCQPFSVAANQRFRKSDTKFKRKGFADSNFGDLVNVFIEYIEVLRPECFILENVVGLQNLDRGRTLARYLGRLHRCGYVCSEPTVLNAVNFGVPQHRERLFVVGVRGSRIRLNLPRSSGDPIRVVACALTGMSDSLPNHAKRAHKPESIARYRKLRFGEREPLGRVDRLNPREPSKTIISGGSSGGGRSHLHPFIARTLTVRECARLQGFNDGYIFKGSIARQFTQVGNAVPPQVAFYLGKFIMKEVFSTEVSTTATAIAPYLDRSGNDIEALCEQLYSESRRSEPDWVYCDSLAKDPGRDGSLVTIPGQEGSRAIVLRQLSMADL